MDSTTTMNNNATTPGAPSLGKPQSQSRVWFEPVLVLTIMLLSLYMNRRRSSSTFTQNRDSSADALLPDAERAQLSRSPSPSFHEKRSDTGKATRCCAPIESLDTSRFVTNLHSRVLQKFPFLVEMFYWALNYVAYTLTKKTASSLYGGQGNSVTELAQQHAIDILNLEHHSVFSIFFPIEEVQIQGFFLQHQTALTFLNQIYSLVHIPGTVAYLSWYYYAAPNHDTFAVARRTMTLGNFAAFIIFCFYPCMPPRLLPESFGFKDTVRQDHAESVWTGGNNVNQLAAMPSLHFTYAFIIGCTFLYHSGVMQMVRGRWTGRSPFASFAYLVAGILYPLLVLTVITATANHFILDAVVAVFSVTAAFLCNRIWLVLLPIEHLFCWILRIEKPEPTTGSASSRKDAMKIRRGRALEGEDRFV